MARRVIFSDEARANIRDGLARFLKTDCGDVKQLHGFDPPEYRLRVGDWRIIFRKGFGDTIEVVRVRNRREAYR